MLRFLTIALAAFVLSACAGSVHPAVTRYSEPGLAVQGKSFTIVPQGDQQGSLEFDAWASAVQAKLQILGMTPDLSQGDIVVTMTYGVGQPQALWRHYPFHGHYYGPYMGARYCASHFCYGTGAGLGHELEIIWEKFLHVRLYDGQAFRNGVRRMVWEGRASLHQDRPHLSSAMPGLVRGLFTNFPGPSGITQRVSVPVQK